MNKQPKTLFATSQLKSMAPANAPPFVSIMYATLPLLRTPTGAHEVRNVKPNTAKIPWRDNKNPKMCTALVNDQPPRSTHASVAS